MPAGWEACASRIPAGAALEMLLQIWPSVKLSRTRSCPGSTATCSNSLPNVRPEGLRLVSAGTGQDRDRESSASSRRSATASPKTRGPVGCGSTLSCPDGSRSVVHARHRRADILIMRVLFHIDRGDAALRHLDQA